MNRSALVSPDRRISLLLAGGLSAAGRTIEQVRPAAPAGPGVEPTINTFIMGEATRPGKLAVSPGTAIIQLFAEMGGFSNFPATKRIQLRRPTRAALKRYIVSTISPSNLGPAKAAILF